MKGNQETLDQRQETLKELNSTAGSQTMNY